MYKYKVFENSENSAMKHTAATDMLAQSSITVYIEI